MIRKTIMLLLLSLGVFASEISREIIVGKVSFYGGRFHGRKTASGEIFDKNKLTCASNQFPLGTHLKVYRILDGDTLSVKVKVNDRMSKEYGSKRILDLSEAAMKEIKARKEGIVQVHISVI